MMWGTWALVLACLGGIALSAGALTPIREATAVIALVLFTVAAIFALIPMVST